MKKKDKIKLIIISIFLIISSITIVIYGYTSGAGIGQPGNNMMGKGYFKAFTVDSNLFLAIISLIIMIYIIKNWNNEQIKLNKLLTILSLSATTSVMLTFITVLVFLEPMYIINGGHFIDMYYNGLFFFHFLNPLLGLYSYIKLQKTTSLNKKELLYTLIPMILYSILYLTMVLTNIWDDFYNFTFGGKYYLIPLIIIIMYSVTYLISLLIIKIKKRTND